MSKDAILGTLLYVYSIDIALKLKSYCNTVAICANIAAIVTQLVLNNSHSIILSINISYCKFVAITCYTAAMEQKLHTVLQKNNYRVTEPRKHVFSSLSAAEAALSVAEIIKLCPSVERTSIYRTLELFVELDIAHIVPHGWKHSYELSEPFRPHHHHFTCDTCGSVLSIMSETIENSVRQLVEQGLTITSHTFEAHGLCRDCSALRTSSSALPSSP